MRARNGRQKLRSSGHDRDRRASRSSWCRVSFWEGWTAAWQQWQKTQVVTRYPPEAQLDAFSKELEEAQAGDQGLDGVHPDEA